MIVKRESRISCGIVWTDDEQEAREIGEACADGSGKYGRWEALDDQIELLDGTAIPTYAVRHR